MPRVDVREKSQEVPQLIDGRGNNRGGEYVWHRYLAGIEW
jgi:hypothetical protein